MAMADTTRPTSATEPMASTRRVLRRWKTAAQPRGKCSRPLGSVRSARSASVFGEGIPDAPHRPDVAGLGRIGLDLVPDVADVDIDGALVLLERVVVVAHQLEQLAAGVDPAGPGGQVAQQVELGGRQADSVAVAGDPSALEIDHQ